MRFGAVGILDLLAVPEETHPLHRCAKLCPWSAAIQRRDADRERSGLGDQKDVKSTAATRNRCYPAAGKRCTLLDALGAVDRYNGLFLRHAAEPTGCESQTSLILSLEPDVVRFMGNLKLLPTPIYVRGGSIRSMVCLTLGRIEIARFFTRSCVWFWTVAIHHCAFGSLDELELE